MTDPNHEVNTTKISTALLLAAGTGTRLQPLTFDAPKCLTEVGGISILERLVETLRAQGITRLIVVTGHLSDCIEKFLQQHASDMQVDYVFNPVYQTTNNIYSFWLARQQIREPFLLVESDLVFETWMLDEMMQPDKMAISKMLPWMNGTTVELETEHGFEQRVKTFRMGDDKRDVALQYKTVNLYSLSLDSWHTIEERLSQYVSQDRLGEYYEAVFAELVAEGTLSFDAAIFDADRWYEIDTRVDLHEAEKLFSRHRSIIDRSLKGIEPAATVA